MAFEHHIHIGRRYGDKRTIVVRSSDGYGFVSIDVQRPTSSHATHIEISVEEAADLMDALKRAIVVTAEQAEPPGVSG